MAPNNNFSIETEDNIQFAMNTPPTAEKERMHFKMQLNYVKMDRLPTIGEDAPLCFLLKRGLRPYGSTPEMHQIKEEEEMEEEEEEKTAKKDTQAKRKRAISFATPRPILVTKQTTQSQKQKC